MNRRPSPETTSLPYFGRSEAVATLVALGSFLIVLLATVWWLDFDVFRSDIEDYWNRSFDWASPWDPVHVPLLPLLAAAVRGVSAGALDPRLILWLIALAGYLLATVSATRIVTRLADAQTGLWAGILVALWPFTGTADVVWPAADYLACGLFLFGLERLGERSEHTGALALGLALLANKAIWPFVGMATLFMVSKANLRPRSWWTWLLLAGPLAAYWLGGIGVHGTVWWPLAHYFQFTQSRSLAPVLDGLLGNAFVGGFRGWAKELVVVSVFVLALELTRRALAQRRVLGLTLSVSIPTLLWILVLNHAAIWAAIRYSKLLAVPLAILVLAPWARHRWSRPFLTLVSVVLLGSQIAFMAWTARVFFGPG